MIWITETGIPQNKMARFDPVTQLWTEYALPRQNAYPHTVWAARNGDIYFTFEYGDGVGRIDQETQRVTEYAFNTKRGRPYGIQEGPDGNIWVVEFLGNKVVRLDPRSGQITEWLHPDAADDPGLRRLAVAPDGKIWFVEHERGAIGRFDPQTESWQSWYMPRQNGSRQSPYALNFDSKGQLWVNNFGGNYVSRFDPQAESFTVYPYLSPNTTCRLMAFDANDVLWCASSATPVLVRLAMR
jgi:virginiamycin B lyase